MDGWMDGWTHCKRIKLYGNSKSSCLGELLPSPTTFKLQSFHIKLTSTLCHLKKNPQNHTSTTNPKPNFISNNNTVNRLQWIQFNSCIRSVFWLPGWRMQNSYPGKIHSIFEAIDAIPQAVATNPTTTTTTITTVNANVCGVGRKTASSIPWRRLGVNDLGNVQMSEWTT